MDLGEGGSTESRLAADSAKCAEVPYSTQMSRFHEEIEFRFKNERKRRENLEIRVQQLESTVARFQQVFMAIVQDEVLRTFRQNLEQSNLNQSKTMGIDRDY